MIARLICLAFAVAPLAAQGQLWVVDNTSSCPLVDFADIQSAVDAASDGDTILVRSLPTQGPYAGFTISGKGLRLISEDSGGQAASGKSSFRVAGDVLLQGLPWLAEIVIGGMHTVGGAAVLVDGCNGEVWFEDCYLDRELLSTPAPAPALELVDSTTVALIRSEVRGVNATFGFFLASGPGGVGLRAEDTNVQAYDCTFLGGFGGNDSAFVGDGYDADSAVVLAGESQFNAFGCVLIGGNGGGGGADAGSGGDGGHGLEMQSVLTSANLLDCSLTGGSGGSCCFAVGAQYGASGEDIAGIGKSNAQTLPGLARRFAASSATIAEGQPLNFQFDGQPGDLAILTFQLLQSHDFLPAFNGSFLLTHVASVLVPGPLDANGALSWSISIPPGLAGVGQSFGLYTQGVFQSVQPAFFLGPGAAVSILDELHSPTDGC